MEEIWLTTWHIWNLVNNGINYQPQLVNPGFLNHQQYDNNDNAKKKYRQKLLDVDDLMDVFSSRSHAIDIWSTLVAIEFAWSSGSFQGFRVKLCLFVNMISD